MQATYIATLTYERNALQIAEETRQTGAATLEELDKQGEQLKNIKNQNEDLQANVKLADNVATQLGFWGWFDCCTGADKRQRAALAAEKERTRLAK